MANILKTSLFLALVVGSTMGCKTDADCADSETCVIEPDGYYSQCIDCDADSFATECQYWSEQFLEAAELACDIDDCAAKDLACVSDDDCDGTSTTKCVTESDGLYAQCIDCAPDSFGTECQYWSQPILVAAEVTCDIASCAAIAPLCVTDDDCTGSNTTVCVVEEDGKYAQCIDCDPTSFGVECQYWSQPILQAAEATCAIPNCASLSGQCVDDDDCTATNTSACAIQADKEYSQCVDCNEKAFQDNCIYWSDAIVIAAQQSCDTNCISRCPMHTDEECEDGEVCAVETSGYYEQCVDCSDEETFQEECLNWNQDMQTAAQEKCGFVCDDTTTTKEIKAFKKN